jgi:DNA modification methylase
MNQLNQSEIEFITRCLKEGRPLPDSYRYVIPFETKKEYELTYADKEREEDILADTFAVPLQPVKTFGSNGNSWTNKLIFGDNLQVLKTLMNDPDVKGKVRLVYIDPPFATKQEFRGSKDQKAYQDKLVGAEFLEFLRKRLIFLRDLLTDDGSIYVHLDWKKAHYVKSLMDEIFGEHNFIREIIWRIGWVSGFKSVANNWVRNHDTLLYYAKNKDQVVFNKIYTPYPPDYERWGGRTKGKGLAIEDVWGVFPQEGVTSLQVVSFASQYTGFPTQKPEGLCGRIIQASSKPGDLVLDAFAGSGTTGAVAEKLGRRWIIIDCGKLAIYTMQKRLLNLREEIGNRGKPLKANPFTLYNAGLYDYQKLKQLPWEEYRDFVLKLFQCRDEGHKIAGVDLDGYLGADDVLVFNYQKYRDAVLDKGFIDDLHSILGDKIGRRFFIIAPAASVIFLEDYIEKGNTSYFMLRIPYSIIDELHRKGFTHIKQPVSEMDINNTVDAVGFDFIQIPDVECEYYMDKPEGQVGLGHSGKDAVIKIKKFESNIISKKPLHYKNLETLSMVMVDYSYDGEVFNFTDVFYAEDMKKQNYEIRFDSNKLDGQMMLIYIDIFGNEKREVKRLGDFGKR